MQYSRARFDALTDGVFAVVMTLLVLDIRLPETASFAGVADLVNDLTQLRPKAVAYALSFAVLGLAWLPRALLEPEPAGMTRREAMLGLAYLFCLTLVPFSTLLIGRFAGVTLATWAYCANLGALGVLAAAMRMQIPKAQRSKRHARLVASALLLAATSAAAAVVAALTPSHALWIFALNALGPTLDRAAQRFGS